MTLISVQTSNPDSASIANKQVIDISFSMSDVSSSLVTGSIQPNYTKTGNTVIVPRYELPVQDGRVYYTPVYTEKINYDQWLARINKTFVELN